MFRLNRTDGFRVYVLEAHPDLYPAWNLHESIHQQFSSDTTYRHV